MGVLFSEVNCSSCSFHEANFVAEDLDLLRRARGDEELIYVIGRYGKNPYGKSALYAAALCQDVRSCQILVSRGAIVSAEILSLAERNYDTQLIKVLKETKPCLGLSKYEFLMTKKDYLLSTEFEIDSEELGAFKISKPKIALKTQYVLENQQGCAAHGSVRILSMGSLFAWGKDIDLYDQNGEYLGMIDGEALTTAEAKFSFFDKDGKKVGIAYLDDNKTGFTIVHPYHSSKVIARLTREFIPHIPDPWKVRVYQGQEIDQRLIQIFAAFALDSASSFIQDA